MKIYHSIGRFDSAEKLILTTMEETGNAANLVHLLGITFHKQSKFSSALKAFKKSIDINPQYIEAYYSLVVTLCDLGRYDEASEVFRKTGQLNNLSAKKLPILILGRLANLHAQIGHYYQETGLKIEAIQEYHKAINLYPRLPDIKIALAKLYLESNQLDKCQKELKEIIEMTPYNDEALVLQGIIYYRMGAKELAQNNWLKARQVNPNNQLARLYLRVSA